MVGFKVAVVVGVLVGRGDGVTVGVADGVMLGVGGGSVMRVGETAVAANVGIGFETTSFGRDVQPINNQMNRLQIRKRILLPGQFTGFFFHQAFVIATPQIRFPCHGFELDIDKAGEQISH
jgi:hypothetical protein